MSVPHQSSDKESVLGPGGTDPQSERPAVAHDMREHERFEITRMVEVTWIHGDELTAPIRVEMTDISRGGCRLMTRQMVNPGSRGILLLCKGPDDVIIRCFEILHCQYASGLKHACGAKWVAMPAGIDPGYRQTNQGPRLDVA